MATNPVNDLLALFCSTFRCELDSYQKRAYERALVGINSDVLLAAADALIDASAAGRKFFPMPTAPEVKGMCASIVSARRKAAADLFLESCEHDSHFIDIEGKVQRCPCWTQAQQAMDAVGHAIALPSAVDQETR